MKIYINKKREEILFTIEHAVKYSLFYFIDSEATDAIKFYIDKKGLIKNFQWGKDITCSAIYEDDIEIGNDLTDDLNRYSNLIKKEPDRFILIELIEPCCNEIPNDITDEEYTESYFDKVCINTINKILPDVQKILQDYNTYEIAELSSTNKYILK